MRTGKINKGEEFIAEIRGLNLHFVMLHWLPPRLDGWYCSAWCLDTSRGDGRRFAPSRL